MEGLVGSRARVVGATMVRRAGLIAAVTVLSVVGAGCGADPTMPSQDGAVAPTVPSQDGAVAPTVSSRDRPVAPTVTSRDRPARYACGPGTDAATARTIGVYVAVLQQLTGDPHDWLGRVLYVVDRAVPEKWVKDDQAPSRTDNNGAAVPSERRRPTAPPVDVDGTVYRLGQALSDVGPVPQPAAHDPDGEWR